MARHITFAKSSALLSAAYRVRNQTLALEFTAGTVYALAHVPEFLYDDLVAAESAGAFFNGHIRSAGFEFTRLGPLRRLRHRLAVRLRDVGRHG